MNYLRYLSVTTVLIAPRQSASDITHFLHLHRLWRRCEAFGPDSVVVVLGFLQGGVLQIGSAKAGTRKVRGSGWRVQSNADSSPGTARVSYVRGAALLYALVGRRSYLVPYA